MSEPNTVNVALIVPNTGDLPAAWGTAAMNPNFQAIDGMFAGKTSIALSVATTIALSLPSGSLTPGGGPNQSQNAVIKLTGTLSGNAVLQFGMPGRYIIDNRCTVGAFYVQLAPASGGGNAIGAPPGRKCTVFFDGTDMDYVDPPEVGSFLDLCVGTTPAWMSACTVVPYLVCDGTVRASSGFPALSAQLGSTFGGNGATTFGVPDLLSRNRLPLDTAGANRVTNAVSGIAGNTWGASGGDQRMQSHTHVASVTDPAHNHSIPINQQNLGGAGVGGAQAAMIPSAGDNTGNSLTGISVSNATTGAGSSQNMPPALVAGITFIKT